MSDSQAVSNRDQHDVELSQDSVNDLHGLLVSYRNDQLDMNVKSDLKRKFRVRYKCMDTYGNFIAFGTTGGAIYLYKMKAITHSSCELVQLIPCDQGSIEVIKFLPNPRTDDLLIAIGTTRGSLIIFKLINTKQFSNNLSSVNNLDQNQSLHSELICDEIYRAVLFTSNNNGIKLLECDQDLLDSSNPFNRLYICDSANRLYVLDRTTIYNSSRRKLIPLSIYANQQKSHLPSLILSFNNSDIKINQINVQRSQLLISTDETTLLFDEAVHHISEIGTKKRRKGFYGACFFNPNYKPMRISQINGTENQLNQDRSSENFTPYSSTASINELENLIIFVARQGFRLWQAKVEREPTVKLTHQFEPLIKSSRYARQLVELQNEPLEDLSVDIDLATETMEEFERDQLITMKSDHFERLTQIYSLTLGNLLLSYSQNELFVLDPIGAKLIVWHHQKETIIHVSCSENELFIWSLSTPVTGGDFKEFKLQRLVLLAPTQFVLELHRLHRYWTIVLFVDKFDKLFCSKMALPLDGSSIITTEGGLLRNVLMNAWDMYRTRILLEGQDDDEDIGELNKAIVNGDSSKHAKFEKIICQIIEESKQLKQSLDNLQDSRFFVTMADENIDRLFIEPYTSLVSLEVSIADLHTNHVIHFSKDALNRHKSVANLSRNIQSSQRQISNQTKSSLDLTRPTESVRGQDGDYLGTKNGQSTDHDGKVLVERLRPKRRVESEIGDKTNEQTEKITNSNQRPSFSIEGTLANDKFNESDEKIEDTQSKDSETTNKATCLEDDLEKRRNDFRCSRCQWPKARAHLRELDSIQRIQMNWIDENLSTNFEANIDQIEQIAFKSGLWRLYLKCLAAKDINGYIVCCISLNDIRLLESEKFTNRYSSEDFLELILEKLDSAVRVQSKIFENKDKTNETELTVCLKCESVIDPAIKPDDSDTRQVSVYQDEDESSYFNLTNLFDRFTLKRHVDVRKYISLMAKHSELLKNSNLTSNFYLKAISRYVTNQSAISKTNKINQVRA